MIREIQENDVEELIHLYAQLHGGGHIREAADSPKVQAMWQRIRETPGHHIIVAEVDAHLVAACSLTVIPNLTRDVRPYALLENVITDEGHRHQGYATACLTYAEDIARAEACYKIMLTTGFLNEASQALYRSLGFSDELRKAFVKFL